MPELFIFVVLLEYHFVTREEMQSKIDGGHFIEYAVFSGNMYGTRLVVLCYNYVYCCITMCTVV